MPTIILTILSLCLITVTNTAPAAEAPALKECEIIIDDFSDGLDPGWKHKSFKGDTEYTWTRENDKTFIRASSNGTASGLFYEIEYDPGRYPYITWQWQVDQIIGAGDATKKSGDDYAARVYVVFPAFFFWNTKAINYIWANRLPKGETIPNPYTANAAMISVESGPAETGKWLTETRNIYEDYKKVFGGDPPKVGAIAIMTDSDDTGASARAAYGPIAICSRDPGK